MINFQLLFSFEPVSIVHKILNNSAKSVNKKDFLKNVNKQFRFQKYLNRQ